MASLGASNHLVSWTDSKCIPFSQSSTLCRILESWVHTIMELAVSIIKLLHTTETRSRPGNTNPKSTRIVCVVTNSQNWQLFFGYTLDQCCVVGDVMLEYLYSSWSVHVYVYQYTLLDRLSNAKSLTSNLKPNWKETSNAKYAPIDLQRKLKHDFMVKNFVKI